MLKHEVLAIILRWLSRSFAFDYAWHIAKQSKMSQIGVPTTAGQQKRQLLKKVPASTAVTSKKCSCENMWKNGGHLRRVTTTCFRVFSFESSISHRRHDRWCCRIESILSLWLYLSRTVSVHGALALSVMNHRFWTCLSLFPLQSSWAQRIRFVRPDQVHIKRTLDDGGGHCLLEMPTGTGKTVCLYVECCALFFLGVSKKVSSIFSCSKCNLRLSLIVSYQYQSSLIHGSSSSSSSSSASSSSQTSSSSTSSSHISPIGKLIYCTRTVQEMDKTLDELKRVIKYRDEQLTLLGLPPPQVNIFHLIYFSTSICHAFWIHVTKFH